MVLPTAVAPLVTIEKRLNRCPIALLGALILAAVWLNRWRAVRTGTG